MNGTNVDRAIVALCYDRQSRTYDARKGDLMLAYAAHMAFMLKTDPDIVQPVKPNVAHVRFEREARVYAYRIDIQAVMSFGSRELGFDWQV